MIPTRQFLGFGGDSIGDALFLAYLGLAKPADGFRRVVYGKKCPLPVKERKRRRKRRLTAKASRQRNRRIK